VIQGRKIGKYRAIKLMDQSKDRELITVMDKTDLTWQI